MRRPTVLLLCLLAVFPAVARAAEPADPEAPVRLWYGMYMRGEKVGWAVDIRRRETVDGKPAVTAEYRTECRVQAYGADMSIRSRERLVFDAESGRLLTATRVHMLNDDVATTVVSRVPDSDDDYLVSIVETGDRRELPWNDLRYSLSDAAAAESWVRDPARRPGDTFENRNLDLDRLQVRTTELRIEGETDWTGDGFPTTPARVAIEFDPLENTELRVVADKRDGLLLEAALDDLMTIRREPADKAREPSAPPDIVAMSLVPCDRPLGGPETLRGLEIEITGDNLPDIPATAGQSVSRKDASRIVVRSGEGAGIAVRATDDEIAEALRGTPRLPIDLPAVRKLAADAVGSADTDEEKIVRLLAFVSLFVRDAPGETLSLPGLLQARRGDCTEHALLFTALARASGIPCREITGWMYFGDRSQAFGSHAWNEVVLDGHWVPVDPTWNERTPSASHIHLASGDNAVAAWKFLTDKLRIRILSTSR